MFGIRKHLFKGLIRIRPDAYIALTFGKKCRRNLNSVHFLYIQSSVNTSPDQTAVAVAVWVLFGALAG
jgi:hypothetical protein